jgi:hypothetical protein
VNELGGRFPSDVATLKRIPGVGSYTAGAVASIAFQQPAALVDGNVIRVLSRMRAVGGDPSTSSASKVHWALAAQVSSLGDAESSLGDAYISLRDAKSSLGDAESSLGDAESSLGDAKSSLGDADSSLGDAKSSLGDAESSLGDAKSSVGDADSSLGDAESSLGDVKSSLGDAESSLGDAESSLGDAESSLGDAESSLGDVLAGARLAAGRLQPGADGAGGHRVHAQEPVVCHLPAAGGLRRGAAAASARAVWRGGRGACGDGVPRRQGESAAARGDGGFPG